MKLLSALAPLLFTLAAYGQGTPDIQFQSTFSAQAPGTAHSNKGASAVAFRFTYYTAAATGVSVRLEGTDDLNGSPNPANWGVLTAAPGSTTPAVGTTSGEVAYCCDYKPWIRVNPTTLTGNPGFTLTAQTYGYKGTSAASVAPGTVFGGPFTPGNVIIGAGGQNIQASTTPLVNLVVNPMTDLGDMIFGQAAGAPGRVPASISPNTYCLLQTGTGVISAQPAWGPCPTNGTLTYYIAPTPSNLTNGSAIVHQDIQMLTPPYSPITNIDIAHNAAGDVVLQSAATDPGFPGLTFIPAGQYTFHIHAERLSGNRAVTLYGVFREVTATGVSVGTIGTQTESTPALTGAQLEYPLEMPDANTYSLASLTSRIVLDIHAVFTGGSNNTTVRLFVGGTADSHISLPSNTIDATTFIPYTGATASVYLGDQGLFINGTATLAFLPDSVGTPAAPTVTQGGTGGVVHYAYKVAWLTLAGNSLLSAATTTTTGNATLSVTDYNIIDPGACPAGATGFVVDRTTGSPTGTLPIVGVCGTPMHDIYPSTTPVKTVPVALDLTTGLYASQVTSGSGWFGAPLYTMSRHSSLGFGGAAINGIATPTSGFHTGVGALAEASSGNPVGIYAEASGKDGVTGAAGVNFLAVHIGDVNPTGPIYGGYGGILQYDAGNVPGWSAVYTAALQFSAGSGRFLHVSGFDCQSGWLSSPGTGTNGCVHNGQTTVGGGGPEYFLIDEGNLPSLLGGTMTITPLKSTTGQVFVCADTNGLLVRSAIACVGTI